MLSVITHFDLHYLVFDTDDQQVLDSVCMNRETNVKCTIGILSCNCSYIYK